LVKFICDALEACGCRLLYVSEPSVAPFRFTFESGQGERMGIVVYAFLANSKATRNRPADEHRFQVKYGTKDGQTHELWQDPYSLYTTLFCGIDPERGTFVGADPVLHNPTRHFISIEYNREHAEQIAAHGWVAWERDRRREGEPVEVLVGGRASEFLRYVRFEREALGESQGHRQLIAERGDIILPFETSRGPTADIPHPLHLHGLAKEFQLRESEVLDLIANARRLKMAVRGWVAEEHLVRVLREIPEVVDCRRLDGDGQPDVSLSFRSVPLTVECKNVLRKRAADGSPRVDFQRTRASKSDECSRYYAPTDFDVVAACLHAVEERWTFAFAPTNSLPPHRTCVGKLSSNVRVNAQWLGNAAAVFAQLSAARS
jgi:hypothetical protein